MIKIHAPFVAGIALLGCAFALTGCQGTATSTSSSGPGAAAPTTTVTTTQSGGDQSGDSGQPPANTAEALLNSGTHYNIGSANDLDHMVWNADGESGTADWVTGNCDPSCAAGKTTTKKVKFQFENGDKDIDVLSLLGKPLGHWTTRFPGH